MADAASASGATNSSLGEFKEMREYVAIDKEEFICKMDRKKGWSRDFASFKWNEFLAESCERDNLGANGALRLLDSKGRIQGHE